MGGSHCAGPDLVANFFFYHTATIETYTLSLHDALPILANGTVTVTLAGTATISAGGNGTNSLTLSGSQVEDRKSTRLNSSHTVISYAVFCLKKTIVIL